MQENNNQQNASCQKVLKIKSFNKKRRNMSIIWCVVMLVLGVVFFIAGAQIFAPACIALGVVCIVCGIIIIVADVVTQNEVYEVFTPEYYVHIKSGKEGERVYWDTVDSVEYSRLIQAASSWSYIGRVTNFVIDYRIKDKSGNYVLKRALAYVPPVHLNLVQSVIPVLISGGKYADENRLNTILGNLEADGQPVDGDGQKAAAAAEAAQPEAKENVKENSAGAQKTVLTTNGNNKKPYVKMPSAFIALITCGAIFGFLSIICFFIYELVPFEPLIIVGMVCSISTAICFEWSNFNIRAIYRSGYNPSKRKLTALYAVMFVSFFATSVYAIATFVFYIPKLICIIGFVLCTVACLAETIYFALKKQPPQSGKGGK